MTESPRNRRRPLWVGVAVSFSLAIGDVPPISADAIPGLFNTGVDAAGRVLPAGAVDPHYVLVNSADALAPGPRAWVVKEGFPIPPWVANGPDSKWIAPTADQGVGNQPGNYTYRLTFDLTGFEPETAVVRGRWSSDNRGVDVLVNGSGMALDYDGDFTRFSPEFVISNRFGGGTNTIEFVVNNAPPGVNPTGLRVEVSGTADRVAPPGTPPSITRSPQSVTTDFKDAAFLTVQAWGSRPLECQWRRDGRPIAGATAAQLIIPFAGLADAGGYDAVVRNPFGAATSQVANLRLRFPSPAQRSYEPLGPCSRRTGIVISELMYHPPKRADGKDLEFVELYNSNPFFEDLGGWRLEGEANFEFPPGTRLGGHEFLVVAADPDALRATYGLTNGFGPFKGSLSNGSGTVRLRKRSGGVVLVLRYDDAPPWPLAADGLGHSLVLARPSYGERDPAAWAASAVIGGSPGRPDPIPSGPLERVVINEITAHPAPGGEPYVELYNGGAEAADLSGCRLHSVSGRGHLELVFPPGTVLPAGGFQVIDAKNGTFDLAAGGGDLWLEAADGTRVTEAVRYDAQARGCPRGRWPDGAPAFRELAGASRGAANGPLRAAEVVLNEILYHPLSGEDDDQFIEVYNPGKDAVDLTGWRLGGGVQFRFPAGLSLNAGEFLAVARNAACLRSHAATLDPSRIVGDWSGNLADRGERLVLLRPEPWALETAGDAPSVTNWIEVITDDVTYRPGGAWGRWSDGGGSSLERRDPRATASLAPAWADSDETAKAPWVLVETTGRLDLGHPAFQSADQLQVLLLGAGEALIDNVQVLVGTDNHVTNPSFESGVSGWHFQGTHRKSAWETTQGYQSARSLRITASDRGDHVANRIRTVLRTPIPYGTTATLRARVRWLRGHPEILMRLRGGALEAVGRLAVPSSLGTPAQPNSRAVGNAGPAITGIQHRPVLPEAGEPIRVSCRVEDPDTVAEVKVVYRIDPDATLRVVEMTDDGEGPDERARDGIYSAAIPGAASGQVVAFHVEARDAAAAPADSRVPGGDGNAECLVRVGEVRAPDSFGDYRIWLTQSAHAFWAGREKMSNEDVDGTFVYGGGRVIYGAGAHYSGSSYTSPGYDSPTGNLCGYDVSFPKDDPLLGSSRMTLDWPVRDDTDQREQLMFWFLDQYGLPNMYRRYVRLTVNGMMRGTIYDDVQQPGADTVEEWFSGDADGDLYKTDCWNEFDDAGYRIDPCLLNTLENFTTTGGEKKVARYRWNWRPRAVRGSANDFRSLFDLVDALNPPGRSVAAVEALVDVDHWMRTFAMNDLASFWDAFGNANAKNTFLYKPERDGWKLMCWDMDVGLGVFNDPPTAALFDVNDPTVRWMYQTPAFVRRYWAGLEEALNSFFQASAVDPLLDAKYAAFVAAGIPLNSPAGIKSWIAQRRTFLLSQLATVQSAFAVLTRGGADFSTNQSTITLVGTAPVAVRTITVDGAARPVEWTTVTRWSLRLQLSPGVNAVRLEGRDRNGELVAGALRTLHIDYTGSASPVPPVRINEWMTANRTVLADPADGAFEDWFELFNAGDATVSVGGWWLSDDPDWPDQFRIPDGWVIPGGGHLLVWADGQPEQTALATGLHTSFRLDRDGETILLTDPTGQTVDVVRYKRQDDDASDGRWPDGAPDPLYRMSPPTPAMVNRISPADAPVIRILGVEASIADGVRLVWVAEPGRAYRVQYAKALAGTSWSELPGSFLAEAETAEAVDPAGATEDRRFYRVVLDAR